MNRNHGRGARGGRSGEAPGLTAVGGENLDWTDVCVGWLVGHAPGQFRIATMPAARRRCQRASLKMHMRHRRSSTTETDRRCPCVAGMLAATAGGNRDLRSRPAMDGAIDPVDASMDPRRRAKRTHTTDEVRQRPEPHRCNAAARRVPFTRLGGDTRRAASLARNPARPDRGRSRHRAAPPIETCSLEHGPNDRLVRGRAGFTRWARGGASRGPRRRKARDAALLLEHDHRHVHFTPIAAHGIAL